MGLGTLISFSPSDHQCSHKVWGTQLCCYRRNGKGRTNKLDWGWGLSHSRRLPAELGISLAPRPSAALCIRDSQVQNRRQILSRSATGLRVPRGTVALIFFVIDVDGHRSETQVSTAWPRRYAP